MQINDVVQVNDSCAALAKIARRSILRHEARIAELKKLIHIAEQVGASESIDSDTSDEKAAQDVLKSALDRVDKEESRASLVRMPSAAASAAR
jgi:hypothetical protein